MQADCNDWRGSAHIWGVRELREIVTDASEGEWVEGVLAWVQVVSDAELAEMEALTAGF